MMLKEVLNSKNKIHDKINSIIDFNAVWKYDPESKACQLVIEGIYMEKCKKQSALTEWDWQRIADLITTSITAAIKPINDRLDAIEKDIKAIKECPTIKRELKN